jgi:hypothetical protein
MKQRGLTILSPLDKAQIADLNALLRAIGDDVAKQVQMPFGDLTLLHFASWVIFADGTPGPQLIFESNFDGTAVDFLRQLVGQARSGLEAIYRHCTDFPTGGDSNSVFEYLLAHVVNTDTFYVSCGGFTRSQILQENQLRDKIEGFLGQLPGAKDAAAVRRSIQEFVTNDPTLAWARQPAEPYTFLERVRVRDAAIAICILAGLFAPLALGWKAWGIWLVVLAIVFLILYGILRRKEATDPSISDTPVEDAQPDPGNVEQLVSRENRRPQNHLFSITKVKPGMFRFALLKVVLALIELLGRVKFYKGSLGRIPSIHFARWAIINDGTYLLFLSNFDGSWEHYLGEFIDQAADGLTAVWSNAVNFPRTWNLVEGGASDEQRFKSYARGMQLYTQLWYSAYPFLSVVNVENNAAIRAGLWGELDADAAETWLRRF